MRIFLFCSCFAWVTLVGLGCKRSSQEGVAVARSKPPSSLTQQMTHRLTQSPKSIEPAGPRMAPVSKVKKPLPSALKADLQALTEQLRRVQEVYREAYGARGVRDWKRYYKAFHMLHAAKQQFQKLEKGLRAHDPSMAAYFLRTLQALEKSFNSKEHPQKTGRLTFGILQAALQMDPHQKSALLSAYRATIKQVEQQLVAEKRAGSYQVGLLLEEPRTLYRLTEVRKQDIRTTLPAPKNAAHTIGVFLRHALLGMPLAGTDVSVELLDAKTKKQYSTQRLFLLWDGFPKYVGHLVLPPKDGPVLVQVTVSPFPVNRTQYSAKMLFARSTLQFPATIKHGRLVFPKRKPQKSQPAKGSDLIRAIAMVGGQSRTLGKYRLGIALVPMQTLWSWNNGSLKQMWRSRWDTCQLVAYVQDRHSGLLIPNARIEAFVYWKDKRTGLHRTRVLLKPVFDGFFSYRANLSIRPGVVDVRARVDPALFVRYTPRIPGSYSVQFQGLKHPALTPKRYRRRP